MVNSDKSVRYIRTSAASGTNPFSVVLISDMGAMQITSTFHPWNSKSLLFHHHHHQILL
jgi:hypothetical protein